MGFWSNVFLAALVMLQTGYLLSKKQIAKCAPPFLLLVRRSIHVLNGLFLIHDSFGTLPFKKYFEWPSEMGWLSKNNIFFASSRCRCDRKRQTNSNLKRITRYFESELKYGKKNLWKMNDFPWRAYLISYLPNWIKEKKK